jgi:hypothetical protein
MQALHCLPGKPEGHNPSLPKVRGSPHPSAFGPRPRRAAQGNAQQVGAGFARPRPAAVRILAHANSPSGFWARGRERKALPYEVPFAQEIQGVVPNKSEHRGLMASIWNWGLNLFLKTWPHPRQRIQKLETGNLKLESESTISEFPISSF